ncbi:uncharacterized protein LOC131210769 [Anopheles bellator]|uniref:uncharacterized protein LOC131210769 n=1 Tax=Anopheles bellator TaxID=139047 RepID=UPI002647E84F|nr:uncharacterized protein LOC131210769 [Anopheles bellator]
MDKASQAAKRRQDKHHKKVPPPKPAKAKQTEKPKAPDVQHTAPLVVVEARYSKRQIEQNWTEQRELPKGRNDDSDDEQLGAADFEKLLELPASSGGHFLLSSEKHWLEPDSGLPGTDEKDRFGQYFHIDTKQLRTSLGAIPFYQRYGYDEALFGARELNLMRQKAETIAQKLNQANTNMNNFTDSQKVKETTSLPERPRPTPCLVGSMALPKETSKPSDPYNVTRETDAVVEKKFDALTIEQTITQVTAVETVPETSIVKPEHSPKSVPPSTKDTKEDIQQWLDDILEL